MSFVQNIFCNSHELALQITQLQTAAKAQDGKLDQILTILARMEKNMSKNQDKINADIAALAAEVDAESAAINQIAKVVTDDVTNIADLKAQIAVLKAENADVNTAPLEDLIGKLHGNNQQLQGLVPTAATEGGGSAPPVTNGNTEVPPTEGGSQVPEQQ